MDQRLPPLCPFFVRSSEANESSRDRTILISDHEEIKYFKEDIVREKFNCCHLSYIASNQDSLGDYARQETYVDCSDVHDYLPSASLRSPNLLGSTAKNDGEARTVLEGDLMTGTNSSRY